MRSRWLVPLLLVAAWAGCGASDEEQAEQVVKDYNRAYNDGDAESACELTAEEFWTAETGPCEEFIETASTFRDDGAGERLAEGDYEVAIDGDEATVQGTNLGVFALRKIDGDWKLTSVR